MYVYVHHFYHIRRLMDILYSAVAGSLKRLRQMNVNWPDGFYLHANSNVQKHKHKPPYIVVPVQKYKIKISAAPTPLISHNICYALLALNSTCSFQVCDTFRLNPQLKVISPLLSGLLAGILLGGGEGALSPAHFPNCFLITPQTVSSAVI